MAATNSTKHLSARIAATLLPSEAPYMPSLHIDPEDDTKPPSDDSDSGESELIIEGEQFDLKNGSLSSGKRPTAPSQASPTEARKPDADKLQQEREKGNNRVRGNSVWAFSQQTAAASNAVAGGSVPQASRRSREHFDVEQALLYRNVMKPKQSDNILADRLHLRTVVSSYLAVNGFSNALAAFQAATTSQNEPSSLLRSSCASITPIDYHYLISDAARRTCSLYDDDSAWRMDNLYNKEIPLVVLDVSSQALGGSIELLVEKLVLEETDAPYTEGKPAFHFTNVFLIMASMFVCPDSLLTYLTKLFKTVSAHQATVGEPRASNIEKRILQLLNSYVLLNAADLTKTTLERVTAFCVSVGLAIGNLQSAKKPQLIAEVSAANSTLQASVKSLVAGGTAKRMGQLLVKPPSVASFPVPRQNPTAPILSLLDIDDGELCRQICLLSFSLFEKIHVREFLHNAWTDPTSTKHLTGNLNAFVGFSSKFQLWVSSCIVTPDDIETRRVTFRKFIRVCRALYNAQNFEMVNAILEGLRHPAVMRMKRTVDGVESVEKEELEGLNKVMDPFDNSVQEVPYTITSPSIPTIAPLLGVFYRAEDSGKTLLFHEQSALHVVNWSKMIQLAKPVVRWISFQSLRYQFYVLPNIQRFLWQMPGLKQQDHLMEISKQREQ